MWPFKKKEKFSKPTGKIWKMWEHNGWGNSIAWFEWKDRKIHGHLTPMIRIGDEVQACMESGKTRRFLVVEVKQMSNPRDQFFAKVKDLDYLEES